MRTIFLTTVATMLLLGTTTAYAQLSADDFITEMQGDSTKIAAPTEIAVKGDVLIAATMQDAAVKADELTRKEAHTFQEDRPAFMLITSKQGGIGAIATGKGTYRTNTANRDAERLSQRHAYITAFMEAKRNLAQGFNRLSAEGNTVLTEALTKIVHDDETLRNKSTDITETITLLGKGFIRAYEIRSVENVAEESSVYVTISVNGKSLGKFSRPVPAVIEAIDIRTGLTQVFDEIQRGIGLPAGGRAIMSEQGDIYYVGYGSALISEHGNPELQAELVNDARKIASARALDSLTAMVVGDSVIWENKLTERYARGLREFEDVSGNDAIADMTPEGIKRFGELKTQALTLTATADRTQSIRRGVLPPGIQTRTFRDADNVWYHAVAVYNAGATQATADFADEMRRATLIQPIRPPQSTSAPRISTGSTAPSQVVTPGTEVGPFPTFFFDDDE